MPVMDLAFKSQKSSSNLLSTLNATFVAPVYDFLVTAPMYAFGLTLSTDDIFAKYDVDGNGYLQKDEFEMFVRDAFKKHDSAEINSLMSAIDADGDGIVSMAELRAFLRCYESDTDEVVTKSALVLVNVQNDFISGAMANPHDAKSIVPVINGMRDAFDMVVSVDDWHPYHHCAFVESVEEGQVAISAGSAKLKVVYLKADSDHPGYEQELYPRHGVQKTWGAEAPKDLAIKEGDAKIYKGTKPNLDSDSAFFDRLKANDTGLNHLLEGQRITHVYLCGLSLDGCVQTSALHAAELGYVTAVIEDACKALDATAAAPTKKAMGAAGVKVLTGKAAAAAVKKAKGATMKLTEYLAEVHKEKDATNVLEETTRPAEDDAPAADEEEAPQGMLSRFVSVGVAINPFGSSAGGPPKPPPKPVPKTKNVGALLRARNKK